MKVTLKLKKKHKNSSKDQNSQPSPQSISKPSPIGRESLTQNTEKPSLKSKLKRSSQESNGSWARRTNKFKNHKKKSQTKKIKKKRKKNKRPSKNRKISCSWWRRKRLLKFNSKIDWLNILTMYFHIFGSNLNN